MRIIAICRTLNEDRFITRYCTHHAFCNLILIADGGSTDRTQELAGAFPNVLIRPFEQRVELSGGGWMNPEPAHINFLIDWAEAERADWIILDDADSWPNPALRQDARRLFWQAERAGANGIQATRLYLWGEGEYFPKINEPGPGLWAWRVGKFDSRRDERFTNFFETPHPVPDNLFTIEPPRALLHYWEPKVKAIRYAAWGRPQTPIEQSIYWPPEPLPAWALEE